MQSYDELLRGGAERLEYWYLQKWCDVGNPTDVTLDMVQDYVWRVKEPPKALTPHEVATHLIDGTPLEYSMFGKWLTLRDDAAFSRNFLLTTPIRVKGSSYEVPNRS